MKAMLVVNDVSGRTSIGYQFRIYSPSVLRWSRAISRLIMIGRIYSGSEDWQVIAALTGCQLSNQSSKMFARLFDDMRME